MFRNEQNFRFWNTRYAGKLAGGIKPNGHLDIAVGHTQYRAHRLVWLYVRGEPVPDMIDHADRDPLNNRIGNLRAATRAQNYANVGLRRTNSTGAKGVSSVPGGRYRARISVDGKEVHLGRFSTIEEAAAVRKAAAIRLRGEFALLDT